MSDFASGEATEFEPEQGDGTDLVFEAAGEPPCTISKSLIPLLSRQIREGCTAAPRGGVEVGGLLLGPEPSLNDPIVIDEALPISLEYAYGPTFRPSESELRHIAWAALGAAKDTSRKVLGIYRSRTRGEANLRDVDHGILLSLDPSSTGCQVFAILSPVSRFQTSVTVFRRSHGTWTSLGESSFRNRLPEPPPEAVPDSASVPPAAITPAPEFRSAPETSHPAGTGWGLRLSGAALVLAGLAVTGLYARAHWTTAPPPRSAVPGPPPIVHLGFSAAHQNSDWQLTWNRDAVASLTPLSALLTIRDGEKERQVPLSPEDLASGTILYRPWGNELQFTFRVNAQGRNPIEERIRALDGGPPSPARAATNTVRPIRPRPTAPPPAETPNAVPDKLN